MESDTHFCKLHNQQILYICIDDHDCKERRLCFICERDSHKNIPKEKTILVNEFQQLLIEKLTDVGEDVLSTISNDIKNVEKMFEESIQSFKSQTLEIKDQINNMDKVYYNLKQSIENNDKHILDFKSTDFELMKLIVSGNQVEQTIINKKEFGIEFSKLVEKQLIELNNLVTFLKKNTLQIFSQDFKNGLTLRGSQIFGKRFGECHYYNENSKLEEYAGSYIFGKRDGFWKQFKEEDQVCFYEYKNGKRIGKSNEFCQKTQDGNFWCLETYGNFNKFQMLGMRSVNKQKIDDWVIYCNGEQCGGGKYDERGKKTGNWVEPDENYCENKILLKGVYQSGERIQKWNVYYADRIVGEGEYDKYNKQTGYWKESKTEEINIQYEGEYFEGSKKDNWKIFENDVLVYEGGLDENNMRHGQGIEYCRIDNKEGQWKGKYVHGQKRGQWKFIVKQNISMQSVSHKQSFIFDYKDNGQIDAIEYDHYPLVYKKGLYQNDKRIGEWQIIAKSNTIGIGQYDEFNSKTKQWSEFETFIDDFGVKFKITHTGEYRQGKKIGRWESKVEQDKLIGLGYYNEESGKKTGKWVELNVMTQCLQTGEYDQGEQNGEWLYYYSDQQICRVQPDNENEVTIKEEYDPRTQIFKQQHYMKGLKHGAFIMKFGLQIIETEIYRDGNISEWEEQDQNKSEKLINMGKEQIDQGQYDNEGLKQGNWEEFNMITQTIQQGYYKNNKRVGDWRIILKGKKSGGGVYNQNGLKQAEWKEVNRFTQMNGQIYEQAIYQGQYDNGRRIQDWKVFDQNQEIGFGQFDEHGRKHGKWIEYKYQQEEKTFLDFIRTKPCQKEQQIVEYYYGYPLICKANENQMQQNK